VTTFLASASAHYKIHYLMHPRTLLPARPLREISSEIAFPTI
jgi:hypothetical protein